MNKAKQFLEDLIKVLVDHPESVSIDGRTDELGVLLSVKVDKQDMGQVIGRAGETAKAIRHLCKIVGIKENARINIKILEPDGTQ